MSKEVIKPKLLMETIVTWSKCYQPNRLFKRAGKGVYRCSICQLQLPNPFLIFFGAAGSNLAEWQVQRQENAEH